MTPRQTEVVAWLRDEILRRDGRAGDELKWFRVRESPELVAVIVCVGMIGDEGTADMQTRRYRKIIVGPRGGLMDSVGDKRRRLPWSDTRPGTPVQAAPSSV